MLVVSENCHKRRLLPKVGPKRPVIAKSRAQKASYCQKSGRKGQLLPKVGPSPFQPACLSPQPLARTHARTRPPGAGPASPQPLARTHARTRHPGAGPRSRPRQLSTQAGISIIRLASALDPQGLEYSPRGVNTDTQASNFEGASSWI